MRALLLLCCLVPSALAADVSPVAKDPPFSFVYEGRASREFLKSWTIMRGKDGTIVYTDPATKLEVTCNVRTFPGTNAVEWVLHFPNRGTADTPILEKILPLDYAADVRADDRPILHYSKGSTVGPSNDDFIERETTLASPGDVVQLPAEPNARVVSQAYLPYFNLQHAGGGVVGAIGWTGQWALAVTREENRVRLRAGQQLTHLKLHPGESIRTPSILLV